MALQQVKAEAEAQGLPPAETQARLQHVQQSHQRHMAQQQKIVQGMEAAKAEAIKQGKSPEGERAASRGLNRAPHARRTHA